MFVFMVCIFIFPSNPPYYVLDSLSTVWWTIELKTKIVETRLCIQHHMNNPIGHFLTIENPSLIAALSPSIKFYLPSSSALHCHNICLSSISDILSAKGLLSHSNIPFFEIIESLFKFIKIIGFVPLSL